MMFLKIFDPNALPEPARKKSLLAVQREIILQHLYNAVTGFAWLGLLFYVLRTPIQTSALPLLVPFAATVLILTIISALRRMPFAFRAVFLLVLIASEALAGLVSQGINSQAWIYLIALIAVASVLFGARTGVGAIIGSSLLMGGFAWLSVTGRIPLPAVTSANLASLISAWINQFVAFLLTATSITGAYLQLTAGLSRALQSETDLANQLETERDQLEVRVQSRTEDLIRKTNLLEAARQVSNILASETHPDQLLTKTSQIIREQFSLSFAAIYLHDPGHESARLNAWSSASSLELDPGMMELSLGQPGVVSFVIQKGKPYLSANLALDPPTQPIHPAFPKTRTEIGVPLKIGEKVSGVLDLHSELENAFSPDDIDIFATLADQLSLALEKDRRIQELEQSLHSIETGIQQSTQRTWSHHLRTNKRRYVYSYNSQTNGQDLAPMPISEEALQTGKTVISSPPEDQASKIVAVPIVLRNQTLGVLNLRVNSKQVSPEMVELLEGAVNRLSLSLENVRLLEDLQTRANRERLVGEISSKVRSATDIDSILRTTAGELGRSLGVAEVVIQLNQPK